VTTERPGVLHQVVLDPAKLKDGLIRLGEWPGDEFRGWKRLEDVQIISVLGRAERNGNEVTVTPKEPANA
jgi:hypothetical protein